MRHRLTTCFLLLFFSQLFLLSQLSAQVFVDITAGGNNDGSSWTNAYTDLNVALTNTSSGEIWVANGTYRPVTCNPCTEPDKEMAFNIPPQVQLYGGFAGNETQRDQRDWTSNLTILSGDIGAPNDSLDNSYRVLIAENSLNSTVLDGFIVEEGNADGSFGLSAGGGLYIDANPGGTGHIQIRNCTFRNNYGGGGGAIAIDCVLGGVSQALIRDCLFEGNTASLRVVSTGAGIFMQGNSGAQIQPRIVNCTFRNNFVGNDGACISMTPTGTGSLLAPLIDSCLFENNVATDRGGAIWYRMSSEGTSRVVIRNSRFIANRSGGQGGAIYARTSFSTTSNDTLVNCLFSQNTADGSSSINDGEGGALFLRGSQDGTRNHQIINCVFDRNFAQDRGGAVGASSIVSTAGVCTSDFINCTFSRNKTNGVGGAVHADGSDGVNTMTFTNSIFWEDSTATAVNKFFNNGATIMVAYSDVDGGIPTGVTDGGNNLDTLPHFADPANGDLHLTSCSPLLNIGNNAALPATIQTDLDGDNRIHAGVVDLGAYEIGIIYVDLTATAGDNTGSDWANAFLDLQDGIARSNVGDQIWVADGTYFPVNCSACSTVEQEIAFQLKPDVEVYGGFAGNETQRDQRDWTTNLTILSGDIGQSGDSTDNTYRVLIAENSTVKTILDGFIIEEGNADGSFGLSAGGGLYIDANPGGTGHIQVRNCTFRNNYGGGGGAIAIDCVLGGESEALIRDCLFEGNTASLRVVSTGAGIFMQGNSGAQIQPRIVNCTFRNNFVGNDGACISMTPTGTGSLLAPLIDSCLFENNVATDRGGAIWYRMSSEGTSRVVIRNSRFVANRAGGQGGAIYARTSFNTTSNDTLVNCLFSQNTADGSSSINDGEGGALFLRGSQDGTRNHQIINCVFDRNFAQDRGGAVGASSIVSTAGVCTSDFINCTFSRNKTNGVGGAVHADGSDGVNTMTFTNSIFWEDSTATAANEFFNNGATITVAYSDVDGGIPTGVTDGGNNLDVNPLFLNPENGDLRLAYCSPVKDVGLNNAMPLDRIDLDGDGNTTEPIDIDLDGFQRVFGGTIDLGAYELNGTADTISIALQDLTDVSCNGEADGSVTVVASGGTPPYTYLWSDPTAQTTATATNLAAGTYTATVTDSFGCTQTIEVEIEEPDLLEVLIEVEDPACNGENTGFIVLRPRGGTSTYTYTWSDEPGRRDNVAVDLEAGTYKFTVTDANGCTVVDSRILTDPVAISASATLTNITCNGDGDGSITVSASGGTGNLTYQWSDDPGRTDSVATSLQAGDYTVTILDANGCTFTLSETIAEPAALSVTVITTDEMALGANDGTATANPSGGTGAYTYNWSNGGVAQTISPLAPDTYTVTVTDANGCTAMASGRVNSFACGNLQLEIDKTDVACFGENTGSASATLTGGTDPVTYSWSLPANTPTINNLFAGTYTVTATDATGCSQIVGVTIEEPQQLALVVNTEDPLCNGENTGLISLDPTGGTGAYTYAWSDNANRDSNVADSLVAGTYTFTITDNNGCTIVDSTGLNDPEAIEGSAIFSDLTCNGDSDGEIIINPTGGTGNLTYQWSDDPTRTDSIATGLLPGDYTVTVIDANACTFTFTGTLTEPDLLSVTVATTSETGLGANDGTATANPIGGTGAYTYNWSNGGATQAISPLAPGTYTVTVTDENGCTVIGSGTVNSFACGNLQLEIDKTDVACFGDSTGSAIANLTGGTAPVTYSWSLPANTPTIDNLFAGTYTVTATDAAGCSSVAEVTINEPPELNINLTSTNETTAGANDGTASVMATGGTLPYTFLWSNDSTTASINNLGPGVYEVTVTDANGCSVISEVEIQTGIDCSQFEVDLNAFAVSCPGFSDGTIVGTASGGLDPYTWMWETGQNTAILNDLAPGVYTATITDANGCTVERSAMISEPDSLEIVVNATAETMVGANDGTVAATASGGTAPYVFVWSTNPPQITDSLSGLAPGTYTVTLTDDNGCTKVDSVLVRSAVPDCSGFSTELNKEDVSCFGFDDGFIEIQPNGGVTPYTFSWSTGQQSGVLSNLPGGNYTVTITDGAGCTLVDTVMLREPAELVLTVNSRNADCGFASNATALPMGGTTPYTFNWSTGDTTRSVDGLAVGSYGITVTDANGCEVNSTATIETGLEGITVVSESAGPTCNGDTDGFIQVDVLTGTAPFTYEWNTGDTTSFLLDVSAGNYTLRITDANECSFIRTFNLIEPGALDLLFTVLPPSDNNSADGSILAEAFGGTTPYTYTWIFNNTNGNRLDGVSIGTYYLLLTDAKGCTLRDSVVVDLTPTGINNLQSLEHLQLFPNPTISDLQVTAEFTRNLDVRMEVFDLTGKIIWSQEGRDHQFRLHIDLQDQPGGTYLLRLATDEGYLLRKFVKL